MGKNIHETWHDEGEFQNIMSAVRGKQAAIDVGEGVGCSWVQYRGHQKLNEAERQRVSKENYIRQNICVQLVDGKKWEVRIWEKVDKASGMVVESRQEKTLLKEYTPEEQERHRRWVEPFVRANERRKQRAL